MENFIVSARKYRPMTFDAVVGQDTVTTTLKNAIRSKHLAQAYLFCGPRGVGKTTCARILAKTINCKNITGQVEACDECESCKSFNELRSFNIHELDAASNNSVDDIRNLIDQVRIPPQVGRYSIYIIDEVHMLSAQAFNAFLKTLEEPPAHAIFILATTEKHKIIPTILSRCQIFDFNRIRVEDIVNRLKYVAEKESIATEENALHIIALKADGAMRDALSIFDQIVSFSGDQVTYQNVIKNLNVLDYEYYFKLTESFLRSDVKDCLLILDEIINRGFDAHHLITGLSSHLRDLLVCKDRETVVLLEAGASFRERYVAQSESCDVNFLFKALEMLSLADTQFRSSRNQRLLTELTLIRCCRISDQDMKKKIESPGGVARKTPGTIHEPQPEKAGTSYSASQTRVKTTGPGTPESRTGEDEGTDQPSSDKEPPGETPEQRSKPAGKDEELPAGKQVPPKKTEAADPTVIRKPAKPDPPGTYRARTPSIKEGLSGTIVRNGNDESHTDKKEKSNGIHPFTIDQLVEKWLEYSEQIRNDKPRLATTLKTQLPELLDDYKVVVQMENASQKEDFQKYLKMDMQDYLREALQNDRISIDTTINASNTGDTRPYTDEEKFRFLSEKNPNLDMLKKKLGLDFE